MGWALMQSGWCPERNRGYEYIEERPGRGRGGGCSLGPGRAPGKSAPSPWAWDSPPPGRREGVWGSRGPPRHRLRAGLSMGWTWDLNLGLNQAPGFSGLSTRSRPTSGSVCSHSQLSVSRMRVCVPPPVTSLSQHTGPETFNGRAGQPSPKVG